MTKDNKKNPQRFPQLDHLIITINKKNNDNDNISMYE